LFALLILNNVLAGHIGDNVELGKTFFLRLHLLRLSSTSNSRK